MARKDEILQSFLAHELLKEKYNLKKADLPNTVRKALESPEPIVKSIALIVNSLESSTPITDKELRSSITQYLNTAAI
jgi:hypothetical protein